MRKALDSFVGIFLVAGLILWWPYTGGWKSVTRHRDVSYDPESVFFLSFVGIFLHILAGWRAYEWYNGRPLGAWGIGLALAYTILCIIRLFLHLWGTDEEDDEEEWNACRR